MCGLLTPFLTLLHTMVQTRTAATSVSNQSSSCVVRIAASANGKNTWKQLYKPQSNACVVGSALGLWLGLRSGSGLPPFTPINNHTQALVWFYPYTYTPIAPMHPHTHPPTYSHTHAAMHPYTHTHIPLGISIWPHTASSRGADQRSGTITPDADTLTAPKTQHVCQAGKMCYVAGRFLCVCVL